MASPTYQLRALVLKRTKLGETDVIVTLLSSDGSQVRAVAKGARKPSSSFSSRLEVYAVCDLLMSRGKSLDLVKEARLIESNDHLRSDFTGAATAAPLVELVARASQEELKNPRLYSMSCAFLSMLKTSAPGMQAQLCAAALCKALAYLGFRPAFTQCAVCGSTNFVTGGGSSWAFSLSEGGVVCHDCARYVESMRFPAATLLFGRALTYSTFSEICELGEQRSATLSLFRLLQLWIRHHLGFDLRSVSFLLKEGW